MFIFIYDPPLPAACAKGTMGEKLICLSWQRFQSFKDKFSHTNLTISNNDVHIILQDNTPRTHPCHKVAIFRDCLELMWDFHPYYIEVFDDTSKDAQVTTGWMALVPNLIQ